ncbi:hypothetical protein PRIPAC_92342 [Pristionchus pacificus]|uniref:Uncharacterized protein n=1 Tax=Pristionchus pacificus TaxID=54126 RepID=A0A2A6CD65_PRIPA|nr:hypothetical protein PRIPAC_92342 [Pristionchus pacificus]|eukprot:PDM76142.1 hypothetical protein PRIPAC_39746 [Pristionchus pacificus]
MDASDVLQSPNGSKLDSSIRFLAGWQMLCAAFITLTQCVIGFNNAGFNKAAIFKANIFLFLFTFHFHLLLQALRLHTSSCPSLIGVIISASTIAEPFLVWAIAPDTTFDQW